MSNIKLVKQSIPGAYNGYNIVEAFGKSVSDALLN